MKLNLFGDSYDEPTKKCSKCKQDLQLHMFGKASGGNYLRGECKKCNRTFIESSLQKHIKCCAFMMKKREKFLSQKQRILNLEHFIFVRRLNVQNLKCQFSHLYEILFPFMQKKCNDKRYKMKNWKKKSFNLRYIIKVNKLLRRC